jgi:hypothetical protein
MIQISVCWGSELQGPEANVVESLVVYAERFISVLYELVDGEGAVVGLHYGVGYLKYKIKRTRKIITKNDFNRIYDTSDSVSFDPILL